MNLVEILDSLTLEQKKAIATANGWQSLWHPDNWIRSIWLKDPKMNIDWAGEGLDSVICRILKEK